MRYRVDFRVAAPAASAIYALDGTVMRAIATEAI